MSGFMSGLRDQADGRVRGWAIAIIAVLVIADVVLVVLALNANRLDPADGTAPATTQEPSLTPPAETPTQTDAPPVDVVAEADPRLLASVSDTVAWRATPGSCTAGGGAVEVTADGGTTWTPLSPTNPAPAEIAQVVPTDGQRGSVVFADEACTPSAQRTFTAGGGWQADQASLDGSTFALSDGRVRIAGRDMSVPCDEPLAAAAVDEGALLCADALYLVINDDWVETDISNALDVTESGDALLIAQTDVEGCAGIALTSIEPSAQPAPALVGCAEGAAAPSNVTVAVANDSANAWIWAGDETLHVTLTN